MRVHRLHNFTGFKVLLAVALLLAAGAPFAPRHGSAQATEPAGMVLLAETPLGAWDGPIYRRVYGAEGVSVLLAPASYAGADLRTALALLGAQVLDPGSPGTAYFLAWAPEAEDEARLDGAARTLARFGEQLLLALPEAEIERLERLGLPLERLFAGWRFTHDDQETVTPYALRAITPNAAVQEAVSRVSLAQAVETVEDLSGEQYVTIGGASYLMRTRFTRAEIPITRATRYVHDRLERLERPGFEVGYHYYHFPPDNAERRNVVAEQTGRAQPERIVLVTAHMDSTSNDAYNYAPGADDNASGTTAVLIAAELLSQMDFDYTIRYILFTGEEQGLYGSIAYAGQAASLGEQIMVVFNLDMIAYDPDGDHRFDVHTRPSNGADLAIAQVFLEAVAAYGIDLDARIVEDGLGFSDHSPFWSRGYPGVLAIEKWVVGNPYYHRTTDRITTFNLLFFREAIKAAVATAAHLAVPAPNLTGYVLTENSGAPISEAAVAAASETITQTVFTDEDGYYGLDLPPGMYTLSASAPGHAPEMHAGVAVTATSRIDFALCQYIDGVGWRALPGGPFPGQPVVFSVQPEAGTPPYNITWDFGYGPYSGPDLEQVTEIFNTPGPYTISLTLENRCSAPQTALREFWVFTERMLLPVVGR